MRILLLISLLSFCLAGFFQGKIIDLDTSDSFRVRPGQSVRLIIESNITTGYSWEVVSTGYKKCKITSQEYKSYSDPHHMRGQGGVQIFTLSCSLIAKVGSNHVIKLQYRRPGEAEAIKSREVSYTISYRGN